MAMLEKLICKKYPPCLKKNATLPRSEFHHMKQHQQITIFFNESTQRISRYVLVTYL